jgi:hypothetical protein
MAARQPSSFATDDLTPAQHSAWFPALYHLSRPGPNLKKVVALLHEPDDGFGRPCSPPFVSRCAEYVLRNSRFLSEMGCLEHDLPSTRFCDSHQALPSHDHVMIAQGYVSWLLSGALLRSCRAPVWLSELKNLGRATGFLDGSAM